MSAAWLRKARQELGWHPTVDFPTLVARMVDADLDLVRSLGGQPIALGA